MHRGFSYLLCGHARVGRESLPIANGRFSRDPSNRKRSSGEHPDDPSNRKQAFNRPLPIANGVFGKGVAGAPGQAVCDWSAEAALPDGAVGPTGSSAKDCRPTNA